MTEIKEIKMVKVDSSNIKEIGWADDILYVKYSSGVYKYSGVQKETFEELLKAESKGRFMNEQIKGNYDYKKLEKLN